MDFSEQPDGNLVNFWNDGAGRVTALLSWMNALETELQRRGYDTRSTNPNDGRPRVGGERLRLTAGVTLEVESVRVEELCVALIVDSLPPAERHNLVKRLAHRFGWEVTANDLHVAAAELGIEL